MLDSASRVTYCQLVYYVFFTTTAWTLYVVLMKMLPNLFAHENLRAVVRVAVVLLPALHYIVNQQQSLLDALHLSQNWRKGVFVGGVIAMVYLSGIILLDSHAIDWKIPTGFSTWFNYIIGSPLAEEALYRGILFQSLAQRISCWRAALISTAAFTLLHIPVWILLDELSITQIAGSALQIALYGVAFAVIFRLTQSLWTPLTAHWLNNLILSAIVRY
jgi:membrane protease YdiL (CAAX protease family)